MFYKRVSQPMLFSFCMLLASVQVRAQQSWQSSLVNINTGGRLKYIPDSLGNTIPDFSAVGYYRGEQKIPSVPVVKTLYPSGGNDSAMIQNAIEEVAAMKLSRSGFRGAILLTKGLYKVQGTIKITVAGVVLRGQGDETKIVAAGNKQHTLFAFSGTGSPSEILATKKKIVDVYVPTGAKSFKVNNVTGLKKGDLIILLRPGTTNWISDLQIDIPAPAGTPVLATADGEIVKLFQSERGGITIYQLSPDKKLVYYYAHLQRYADGLAPGKYVRQGEVIAYVGDTGNAGLGNYHLHFSVTVLADPKRYWEGTNINPYPMLRK